MKFTERDTVISLAALVGGMVSTVVIALPLSLILGLSPILVGIAEEPAKVIALIIIALKFPDWLTSKKKCAIFGGFAGLGFAFMENLLYFLEYGYIWERTFFNLPAHVLWAAIVGMGLLYIAAKGKGGYKNALMLLLVAIVLHGLWNATVGLPGWVGGILTFIVSILVFRYIYKKLSEYPVPDEQVGVLGLPKREVWITRDRTFGRKDFKDDLSLEDLEHISREHFKVTRVGGSFFIEDHGSKGGTRLNEAEIKEKGRQELRNGDEITLPGLKMRFAAKADVEKAMERATLIKVNADVPITLKAGVLAKLVLPNDREVEIREKEREFGREDFKDVVSGEKLSFISERHFKITRANEDFYIDDLESSNGTKLNGKELKGIGRRKLEDDDEILVAEVLKVRYVREQVFICCPHCGVEVGPEDAYCNGCGKPVQSQTSPLPTAQAKCPFCGFEIQSNDVFCLNCGKKIKE